MTPRKEIRMFEWITEQFRKPSAQVLAQREYEDAQRGLLEAQRSRDYYDSVVGFHSTRLSRLRAMRAAEIAGEQ